MSVIRYGEGPWHGIAPCENGDYVEYEDYEKLLKFFKMALPYICVEGSAEEEKFAEELAVELGLEDKT